MKLGRKSAVCVFLGALSTITLSSAAPAIAASDATILASLSIPCGPPPLATANFSWDEGPSSTTIYYNNHCGLPKGVTVFYTNPDGNQYKCVLAPGFRKGSEKISYGAAGDLVNVLAGCP